MRFYAKKLPASALSSTAGNTILFLRLLSRGIYGCHKNIWLQIGFRAVKPIDDMTSDWPLGLA